MVLRKITIDNSVRYIHKTEKTKEKEIKPKTVKAAKLVLFDVNKIKLFHEIVKKFLRNVAASGFGVLTK